MHHLDTKSLRRHRLACLCFPSIAAAPYKSDQLSQGQSQRAHRVQLLSKISVPAKLIRSAVGSFARGGLAKLILARHKRQWRENLTQRKT